ncbi:unnamed protein product [Ixodes pacificus]
MVTSVLRFLQQHGQRLGAPDFEGCLPTVEFMELIYGWFVLHNPKSTTVHVTSRDTMRMPFWSPDDESVNIGTRHIYCGKICVLHSWSLSLFFGLSWLQGDCLAYFASWKASTTHKMEFLSAETHEALRVTTTSTVLCTRHLLNSGFHFVLTSKYSSDNVEPLFSTIRQLNESNDQTDAYSTLSALQKILVTEILHSSTSANVGVWWAHWDTRQSFLLSRRNSLLPARTLASCCTLTLLYWNDTPVCYIPTYCSAVLFFLFFLRDCYAAIE